MNVNSQVSSPSDTETILVPSLTAFSSSIEDMHLLST